MAIADEPRRGPCRDAVLYGLGGGVTAIAMTVSDHAIHSAAARQALPIYLAAIAAALALMVVSPRMGARLLMSARVALAVMVLFGAGVVPQLGYVASRAADPTGHHSHAETAVIEEGARTIVGGDDPYDETFDQPGIAYWSAPVRDHFPYLPAMLLLGLPRVLLDDAPAADARIVFVVATLLSLSVAFALWRAPVDRKLVVFQWLVVLPTGTLTMIGGGHDLPVLGLLFLSLVLLHRKNLLAAAVVLGLAAAMRQNAWILVPFFVMAVPVARDRARVGFTTVATALLVTGPFAAWNPDAFLEDVVRWPLNLGHSATNARAPTLGAVILEQFPTGRVVVVAALLGVVLVVAALVTLRFPPRSAAQASLYAGVTLLGLMAMAPSGRVGYLLYPVSLIVWALALHRPIDGGTRDPRPRDPRIDVVVRPPGLEPGTN